MRKSELLEELKKMEAELDGLIAFLNKRPEIKEQNDLVCGTRKNSIEYYLRKEDNSLTFLGTDKIELIKRLAEKRHFSKLLKVAAREKGQIVKCIHVLESGKVLSDIDAVYQSLPEGVRNLSKPIDITDDGYAAEWYGRNSKNRNPKRSLNGPLKTSKGEVVNSKSEVIIADRLNAAGVPYVYEYAISLDDYYLRRFPDFFVLNKRTRQEYFWEHFGMMDSENYCLESQFKLEAYAKKGYFIGKNLLVTFESSKRSLSTEYVDSIISEFLL